MQRIHPADIDTDVLESYLSRAVDRRNSGDYSGAVEQLSHAIELKWDLGVAYYQRGLILRETGDMAAAISDIQKYLWLEDRELSTFFRPGQCWEYRTRHGEEGSRILVYGTERIEHVGVVVHISITGLNPSEADSGLPRYFGHLPISESALHGSVTELDRSWFGFPPDLDLAGFFQWKQEFLDGHAGVWTTQIDEVVQVLDDAAREQLRTGPLTPPSQGGPSENK